MKNSKRMKRLTSTTSMTGNTTLFTMALIWACAEVQVDCTAPATSPVAAAGRAKRHTVSTTTAKKHSILFFVKVSTSYFEYRKHGQFEFAAPAILFACLVFTLTAPLYFWGVVGI